MQLLNSNIPRSAQTTKYSNKKAQDLLNLVLFCFVAFSYYKMVGAVRLELMTSTMSTWRSNQLSYVPDIAVRLITFTYCIINYFILQAFLRLVFSF